MRRRVFFDTNVWVSAIVFPGLCAELLLATHDAGHEWLTSTTVQREVHGVIRRKFPLHPQALPRFDRLWERARCVADVDYPEDDADERLVLAALRAEADLFVTGDARLLEWERREALLIVAPRQAWGLLHASPY